MISTVQAGATIRPALYATEFMTIADFASGESSWKSAGIKSRLCGQGESEHEAYCEGANEQAKFGQRMREFQDRHDPSDDGRTHLGEDRGPLGPDTVSD